MLRRFLWGRRIPVARSLVNCVCLVGIVGVHVGWVTAQFAETEVAVGATQLAVAVAVWWGERPKPLSVGTCVRHPTDSQTRDLLDKGQGCKGNWMMMIVWGGKKGKDVRCKVVRLYKFSCQSQSAGEILWRAELKVSVFGPFWSHLVSIPHPTLRSFGRLPSSHAVKSRRPSRRLSSERMEPESSLAEMVQVYDLSTFEPKPRKPVNEWFLFQNNGTRIADNVVPN
jgi:hypothetical protein